MHVHRRSAETGRLAPLCLVALLLRTGPTRAPPKSPRRSTTTARPLGNQGGERPDRHMSTRCLSAPPLSPDSPWILLAVALRARASRTPCARVRPPGPVQRASQLARGVRGASGTGRTRAGSTPTSPSPQMPSRHPTITRHRRSRRHMCKVVLQTPAGFYIYGTPASRRTCWYTRFRVFRRRRKFCRLRLAATSCALSTSPTSTPNARLTPKQMSQVIKRHAPDMARSADRRGDRRARRRAAFFLTAEFESEVAS